MSVKTLVTCRAIAVLGKPPAFWHPPEVILVQKLACIALLTKTTKPVLADSGESLSFTWMRWGLTRELEILC